MAGLNDSLSEAVLRFKKDRKEIYNWILQNEDFLKERIQLYDFDILSNVPVLLKLFSGENKHFLDKLENKTLIDIGSSNGDLGFAFSDVGFRVTLLDKSHICSDEKNNAVRQNAPLVASLIAKRRSSDVRVLDFNVDAPFDPEPLLKPLSTMGLESTPTHYGLGVAVGLLYHLKNPYGFIESLAKVCEFLVVGTWVFTHLPGRVRSFGSEQAVYLLKDCEYANDPTNYWIFSEQSFVTLVERCGWEVLNKVSLRKGFRSLPSKANARVFLLLRNKTLHRGRDV